MNPKYGLCDECKEPGILGYLAVGEQWICPQCTGRKFHLTTEGIETHKQHLVEQYWKEKKQQEVKDGLRTNDW